MDRRKVVTPGNGFDMVTEVAKVCPRCGNKRYIEATAVPARERRKWAVSECGTLVRSCPDCCVNTDCPAPANE
jgi:hypothetical protein